MRDLHTVRLARAYAVLEGLSVGDAFGQTFVFDLAVEERVHTRRLPQAPWPFTDDTNMALSVFSVLRRCRGVEANTLAQSFAAHYDPQRGYGSQMQRLLPALGIGADWHTASRRMIGGAGSGDTGAAVRVMPVGAYFADDLTAATLHARRQAEITHSDPEAIAGAVAVAVATAIAWQFRGRLRPSRREFIDCVLPCVDPGEVSRRLRRARDLPPGTDVARAAAALGNGSRVTCQDTVPFALWSAGECIHNYAEALWNTAGALGDVDTTCAIVGGVVGACAGLEGIPEAWREWREALPVWPFGEEVMA